MTTEMMASNVVEIKSILDWFAEKPSERVIPITDGGLPASKAKALVCFLLSQRCFEESIEVERGER